MAVGRSWLASMFTVACLPALALIVASSARPAHAEPSLGGSVEDSLKDIWNRDTLTGDWGGLRTDLHDHGIDIGLRLAQYVQSVASGGVETNTEYGGTLDYRIHADLNKLVGSWEGLSLDVHARTRFGDDILADAGGFVIPNTGLMMPAPGDYHGTDVTGLTVSQFFPLPGGRLGNVTFGMLDVVDTVNGFFPRMSYGQEGFWNINGMITTMPWVGAVRGLSLWGGYVATINQEYKMAQTGFLATGTENESKSWGSISNAFDSGVWLAAWHRFFWKLGDKPGDLLVFAGGSTADQPSTEPNDFVLKPGQGLVDTDEKKPWDIAAYLSQVFWQAQDDADRRAHFVIGGTGGPDDPQFVDFHLFAQVEAFGPMASRPGDRMGVSGWYNWISDDFEDLLSPVDDIRDTWGFELYYNLAINKWLHLSADLQLVMNEKGGRPQTLIQSKKNADDLAIIPGARLVIDF